ncbi:unnamed protein product, partial [Closterium sp. Naga37s-1]
YQWQAVAVLLLFLHFSIQFSAPISWEYHGVFISPHFLPSNPPSACKVHLPVWRPHSSSHCWHCHGFPAAAHLNVWLKLSFWREN